MTPVPACEREKMLAVRLCGPRVIARPESIAITKLQDVAERDPPARLAPAFGSRWAAAMRLVMA